jgi:hypothetical protein
MHLVIVLVRERLIGVVGYTVLYFAFLCWAAGIDLVDFSGGAMCFLLLAAALAIGLALVWGVGRMPQVGSRWRITRNHGHFAEAIETLLQALRFGGMRRFAVFLGLSLAGGVLWTMVPLIVARSVGMQEPYAMLGMVVIFIELIRIVPITIQGIGVREGLFAYCFSLLHLPPEQGFLIGTVSYLALSLGLLVVGIASRLIPSAVLPAKGSPLAGFDWRGH